MTNYIYLICPLTTLVLCQVIKFTIESIRERKWKWARLFNGSGGMPSSHTSFSSSITMLIGYKLGFHHPLFAISLVFSMIVAYDAMGLRMESGKQAIAINKIADEIFVGNPKIGIKHLKEQLGHQPLEVLVGILLGTFISLCFSIFF